MPRCPNHGCDHLNSDKARFCARCGRSMGISPPQTSCSSKSSGWLWLPLLLGLLWMFGVIRC